MSGYPQANLYAILSHLDNPTKFLFWTKGELLLILGPFFFGNLFGCLGFRKCCWGYQGNQGVSKTVWEGFAPGGSILVSSGFKKTSGVL